MTLITSNQTATEPKLTAVDLFCGSGAVSLGLKQAGFTVVGAIDINPIAADTYKANHPEVSLLAEDILKVDPAKDFADLPTHVDVLAVCAPCQPFSSRSKARVKSDHRVSLVLASLKFVDHFRPKIVFVENVPGLKRSDVFDQLRFDLESFGYFVGTPQTLDASALGVPQRRPRMVMLASKSEDTLAYITEFPPVPKVTVRDAISNLPKPAMGSQGNPVDRMHYSRQHHPITLQRLSHIPKDGGSRNSLPEYLVLNCHKTLHRNQYPDNYGRMAWNDVAPTLTTGCTDLTKGRYAHPEDDRAITLREAARLQTFPDEYEFTGNGSQVATQIGNAVPPKMMFAIASRFIESLQPASDFAS